MFKKAIRELRNLEDLHIFLTYCHCAGYLGENKNLILVMGHKGNWEWAGNTFSLCCDHKLYVIYHPLANKHFNAFFLKMRERFGTRLIPMKDTYREIVKNRNELNAMGFIADQSPDPITAYWMNFLNRDTPVFMGTEKIPKKYKTQLYLYL